MVIAMSMAIDNNRGHTTNRNNNENSFTVTNTNEHANNDNINVNYNIANDTRTIPNRISNTDNNGANAGFCDEDV